MRVDRFWGIYGVFRWGYLGFREGEILVGIIGLESY